MEFNFFGLVDSFINLKSESHGLWLRVNRNITLLQFNQRKTSLEKLLWKKCHYLRYMSTYNKVKWGMISLWTVISSNRWNLWRILCRHHKRIVEKIESIRKWEPFSIEIGQFICQSISFDDFSEFSFICLRSMDSNF